MIVGIQAQVARLLDNLLETELGHGGGNPERHLAFDMGFGVDDVDLFKLTAGSFNIEEEAEYQAEEVEKCEEEVNTPWTLASEQRREHDDGEVADPVGASRRSRTHSTGTEGVDLGRVDPGQRQESECEENDEEENTNGGTLGVVLVLVDQANVITKLRP